MTDTHHSARDELPAEGGSSTQWATFHRTTGDCAGWDTYDDAIAYVVRRCRDHSERPTDYGVYMQATAYTGWKEMGDGYGRNTSENPTGATDTPAQ